MELIDGARGSARCEMATSTHQGERGKGPASARAQMEEALGKLDISEEEATPLALEDVGDEEVTKWMMAGKVLNRCFFHIQTISSALRPAWGNPRGLIFHPLGDNMFVAEFENQRDMDRVWEGSPWHK